MLMHCSDKTGAVTLGPHKTFDKNVFECMKDACANGFSDRAPLMIPGFISFIQPIDIMTIAKVGLCRSEMSFPGRALNAGERFDKKK